MKFASTVVMIRPLTFCSNTETQATNAFQKGGEGQSAGDIARRAQVEFDRFQKLLEDYGIQILKFSEVPGASTPDALFPNNWFCQLPDGRIFVFPMQALNRRREVRDDILSKLNKTELIDLTSFAEKGLFLEGTGSLILDHSHKLAYACLSPRTSPELLQEFSRKSGYAGIPFLSVDQNGKEIYHTNVMMALGEKNVVINMSSLRNTLEKSMLEESFRKTGKNIVDISHDQMNSFAGNMLFLRNQKGENFWVMSTRALESLTPKQKDTLSSEAKLLHSPIPTIEDYGGGGVRCLMAEIFR